MRRRRRSKYAIPVTILVQIGDDAEEDEPEFLKLATAGIDYPYDARKALPRLLREVADDLEEMANEHGTEAR